MDGIQNMIYVTIFCNSSIKINPENTFANLTVQLAHEIHLGTDR